MRDYPSARRASPARRLASGFGLARLQRLLSANLFGLSASALTHGLTVMVLPLSVLQRGADPYLATGLGLTVFAGLSLSWLIQIWVAHLRRTDQRPLWGGAALLTITGLAWFGLSDDWPALIGAFLLIQLAIGLAHAAQPAAPEPGARSLSRAAFGVHGLMSLSGALLSFLLLGWLLGRGQLPGALVVLGGIALLGIGLAAPARDSAAPVGAWPGDRAARGWALALFLFGVGVYAVAQFLMLFVVDRLRLSALDAADQVGGLLALVVLILLLGAPAGGWMADRLGRALPMLLGAFVSAGSVLGFNFVASTLGLLVYSGLLAMGLAVFSGAALAFAEAESALNRRRLAHLGVSGAAALAGLLGPVVDWANARAAGWGYEWLFGIAAIVFVSSGLVAWLTQRRSVR